MKDKKPSIRLILPKKSAVSPLLKEFLKTLGVEVQEQEFVFLESAFENIFKQVSGNHEELSFIYHKKGVEVLVEGMQARKSDEENEKFLKSFFDKVEWLEGQEGSSLRLEWSLKDKAQTSFSYPLPQHAVLAGATLAG